MRSLLRIIAFLVVGIGVGYWTADYSMEKGLTQVSVRNGAWVTWPAAGLPDADPYTRAHFAATGHLPLTIFEAASFRAETDDGGDQLDQDCEYLIEGRAFRSRWWNLVVYKSDRDLIDNAAGRHSFNSGNMVFHGQGSFQIRLARTARPGNWLPLGQSGKFYLALSLYNPDTEFRANLDQAVLPKITKVTCA